MVREGFARCVDWSMGVVTQGVDKLRAAEKAAKEKKQRIWKDYTPSTNAIEIKDKNFTAKVKFQHRVFSAHIFTLLSIC